MEARALKSSLLSEFSMKSNHQVRPDDIGYVHGGNADDFSVDAFLDLSNDDLQGDLSEQGAESVSSRHGLENYASNCSVFSDSFDSSLFPDELSIPEDDFEDLEWLSRFADDSAAELFPFTPTGISNRSWPDPTRKPCIQSTPVLCFPVPVPAKTRTKRERPCGKVWSSSSSSSSNETSFNKSEQSLLDLKPPAAKQKKKKARVSPETVTEPVGGKPQRRCTHCEVQKTPQWRRGPLGPKTLCNACGVRFKSGRLFPEYRPACSPTFSGDVHSNSHRRVLEMRSRNVTDGVVVVQT